MDRELSGPAVSPFDADELVARCLGNLEFVQRVLAKFQERLDADLTELDEAVLAADAERIARVAHRLKGASANVAAHGLRQRAAGIEELARQRSLDEIPSELDELREEWSRFTECAELSVSS